MEDFDTLLRDAEAFIPEESGLKALSEMARKLKDFREEKEQLEGILKELDKRIRNLESIEIPEKMTELGVAGFKLDTGESVEVKDHVHATIPEKFKPQAFAWLEENGHGDLIKTDIVCVIGKGENEKAELIQSILAEQGVTDVQKKQNVHWGTLTSFVKEQLDQGAAIPFEYLGVYMGKKVLIKK